MQTRLLPWKLLLGITRFGKPGLSGDPKVQVEGVFGSRFRFAFQFRAVSVPVSLFHYKRKTGNCDVQFLLVHFVHGPFTKTGNPSFSGKLLVVIPGSFSGNLKRHVSCQEGRWFSVSISSKHVYIYMFLLHCKHVYTCFEI